jgi:hypothetical protein
MIDKYIIKFLSSIDNFCAAFAKMLESKPKKKRKKKVCKTCKCGCHCKDDLHLHHYDQELCACGKCICTKK